MSTRYVYSDYNSTASQFQDTKKEILTPSSEYNYVGAVLCNSYSAKVLYNRQMEPVTQYIPTGDYFECAGSNFNGSGSSYGGDPYVADTTKYKYIIFYKGTKTITSADIRISDCYLLEFSSSFSGAFWHTYSDSQTKSVTVWNNNNSAQTSTTTDLMPFFKRGGLIEKGNLSGYQSSNSRNLTEGAYSNGVSFGWREYRGSDNIDPSMVSYSENDLYSGEPFEIIVTPRSPTYGGTVYYQYQYSINGGSTWTSIGGKTTATSATVTIPEGATQFRACVVASDGWGFTSSAYVFGPRKEVSQLKAYVGIGRKAVALKKGYVGVGGMAKGLVKGYVGVGGVAKKLF